MKAWPVFGISAVQTILLLVHWFLFRTFLDLWWPLTPSAALALRFAMLLLGGSFVIAALFGFYFSNIAVRIFYRLAATWLGFLNFFFWAACLCRLVDLGFRMAGSRIPHALVAAFFGAALLTGIYGLANARRIRIRRATVELAGLPHCWRGRTALLISDLHLGHINGARFARRIVALARQLSPDIIFIPGDLFDGSHVDPDQVTAPLRELSAPFGVWFATGNHEGFGNLPRYVAALGRAGVTVLANESRVVDGVNIIGVDYHDSMSPLHLRTLLERLRSSQGEPNILLNHVPSRLPIVERAGIALQLSGHTHGGQIAPFTWMTRRIFGRYTTGLSRFSSLQVYTSSGVGTWGPPMRVGSASEVVLLTFA